MCMKSFRDYCDEEFAFVKMNSSQKSSILEKCTAKSREKPTKFRNLTSPYYLKRVAISCLCIVIGIVGIKYYASINKLGVGENKTNGTINFPKENAKFVRENKIKIPDGIETEWTFQEVCSYFGKDIGLANIPEKLNITTLKDPKIVYMNQNNEVVFDNIEFTYQEKKDLEAGAYITILMSKGKMPIVDQIYSGTTDSFIDETKIKICQLNSDKYRIEFMYDDIGYIITTSFIEQAYITDILRYLIS